MYAENRPKVENRPKAENDGFAMLRVSVAADQVGTCYLYRSLFSLSYLTLMSTYYSETSFLNLKARSYIPADSKTIKIN